LGEEFLVLVAVAAAMVTQVLAGIAGVGHRPGHPIELVVAHHRQRRPRLHHGAGNGHGFYLVGAAINKVAEEYHPPQGMMPPTVVLPVVQPGEKLFERGGETVDSANKVLHAALHTPWLPSS